MVCLLLRSASRCARFCCEWRKWTSTRAVMRIWAGFRRLTRDEKKSRIKNRRQARRPVRSLLPAVRAVTGVFREFQSGVKIAEVISLLRSSSPRAYSHKKIMGVMPDIDADFEGKGEFISHLTPSGLSAHPVPISREIRIHIRWRHSRIASQ